MSCLAALLDAVLCSDAPRDVPDLEDILRSLMEALYRGDG